MLKTAEKMPASRKRKYCILVFLSVYQLMYPLLTTNNGPRFKIHENHLLIPKSLSFSATTWDLDLAYCLTLLYYENDHLSFPNLLGMPFSVPLQHP